MIPKDIKLLLSRFIIDYKVIGIGENYRGQLSITKGYQFLEYFHDTMLNGWTSLGNLQKILFDVNKIYVNSYSLMVIDEYDQLHVSGSNQVNRLGIFNSDVDSMIPRLRKIISSTKWALGSQGLNNSQHTFVYSADNELYASGINGDGQFGNGKRSLRVHTATLSPIARFWKPKERITEIHCAQMRSLFLTNTGSVYACGWNGAHSVSPLSAEDYITLPEMIATNIKSIALGVRYNILLQNSGKLRIFGGTRLGDPENAEIITKYLEERGIRIKAVASGYIHALVLSEDNKCYSFGDNYLGQCGTGYRSSWNYVRPKPQRVLLPSLMSKENVIQIACGQYHNVILTNKNQCYSFGYNHCHQCLSGPNSADYILSPHLMDKESELKISPSAFIERVICINHESLIIVNPNKFARRG